MTSEFAIAVHALIFLNHKGDCQSSEKIAENICTHPARVRKILVNLKKAGLVQTKEGLSGGYAVEKNARSVTLETVCKAVEARPVAVSWRSGGTNMQCLIASGMADLMEEIYDQLNVECMKKLSQITIDNIDRKIFHTSSGKEENNR